MKHPVALALGGARCPKFYSVVAIDTIGLQRYYGDYYQQDQLLMVNPGISICVASVPGQAQPAIPGPHPERKRRVWGSDSLRQAFLVVVLLLPIAAPLAQERGQIQYWLELEAADQTYAELAAEIGRAAAFLEFLGEGSVVFRNGPVDALEAYRSGDYTRDELTWESHYIDVSRDGDLGLTAGPSIIAQSTDELDPVYGHLVSIWKKTEGEWHLMADMYANIPGVLSLEVEPSFEDTQMVLEEAAHPFLAASEESNLQSLIDADNNFGRSINFSGGQRALLRYGLDNTRVYLPGMAPAVGADAASSVYGAYLDTQLRTTNPINLIFMGGFLSSSKEMGYSYGTMATNVEEAGPAFETSYLRLWRLNQNNQWRIAVEVLRPVN